MDFTFEKTVEIADYTIQEIVEKIYYEDADMYDAIEDALAGYDDDVYYDRDFFWDALTKEVAKRLNDFKPKTKVIRISGYIKVPAREKEDDIKDMFFEKINEIDFNALEDIEILDIIN